MGWRRMKTDTEQKKIPVALDDSYLPAGVTVLNAQIYRMGWRFVSIRVLTLQAHRGECRIPGASINLV